MCIGNIYKIPMYKEDGITPKGNHKHRDKLIIVIGKDTKDNYLGVVVVNSEINLLFAEYDFLYEIKYEKYKGVFDEDVFEKNSYVDCAIIRDISTSRFNDPIGVIDQWDYDAIIRKITNNPKIDKHTLKKYNINS